MGQLNLKKKKKMHGTQVPKCRYRVLKRHYRTP